MRHVLGGGRLAVETAGIDESERVVADVRIAIERLAMQGIGHQRVGRQETLLDRVVGSAVVVDEPEIVVVPLTREAERHVCGRHEVLERRAIAACPPPERLVIEPFEKLAIRVKDRADRAEAVSCEVEAVRSPRSNGSCSISALLSIRFRRLPASRSPSLATVGSRLLAHGSRYRMPAMTFFEGPNASLFSRLEQLVDIENIRRFGHVDSE